MELQVSARGSQESTADPDGCASAQRHKDGLEACLLAMQTVAAT